MFTSDLDLTDASLDAASGFQEPALQPLDELAVTREALGLNGPLGCDAGGAGDDVLYGGSFDNQADGATDIFVFNDLIGDGNDSVYGFEDGIDLIRLAGVGPGALSITNVDGGAQVEVGDTGFTLYVDGMTAGTLTSDDFIFV